VGFLKDLNIRLGCFYDLRILLLADYFRPIEVLEGLVFLGALVFIDLE
jgi:hypothetical protein